MSTNNNAEPIVLPAVTVTDDLSKAIQEAVSAADVKALLIAEAQKQLDTKNQHDAEQAAAVKAAADKAAADAAAVAAAQAAIVPEPVVRTETIGGKTMEFTGADEAEVDRLVLNAFKVAYALRPPEQTVHVDPAAEAAKAAAAAEAQVAAKAELERKFRLNEISAAEYIQQSGAVKSYLESEGVSLDALKETVNANRNAKFEQSWKQAAEEFVKTPAGADWPGGDKNQELLGLKIAAMNLVDTDDKIAAIAQAYADLKKTGMLFPGEVVVDAAAAKATADAAAAKAAADAAAATKAAAVVADPAAEAARAAAAARVRSTSSSIFGASSGTSGAPVTSPAVVAAAKVVPDNATPAEILQAWKEAQISAGKNPDEAFMEDHRGNRI